MDFATTADSRVGTRQPSSFESNMQSIASAAHRRGVVILKSDALVGALEAADFCGTIRTAHTAVSTNETARDHVERLANGIVSSLARRGAVGVSQSAWNLLQGYARRPKGSRGQAAAPSVAREPARCRTDRGAE